ncbi:hypothetical protein NN561_010033 [Cricetulus griseus]
MGNAGAAGAEFRQKEKQNNGKRCSQSFSSKVAVGPVYEWPGRWGIEGLFWASGKARGGPRMWPRGAFPTRGCREDLRGLARSCWVGLGLHSTEPRLGAARATGVYSPELWLCGVRTNPLLPDAPWWRSGGSAQSPLCPAQSPLPLPLTPAPSILH